MGAVCMDLYLKTQRCRYRRGNRARLCCLTQKLTKIGFTSVADVKIQSIRFNLCSPIMPDKYLEKKGWNVPKQNYKLRNWPEYNESLRRRGSIDVWLSEEVVDPKNETVV